LPSYFLDKIVEGKGLLELIDALNSPIPEISKVASDALAEFVPNMKALLHVLHLVNGHSKFSGNKEVNTWLCYNFFRLMYIHHRPTPLNSNILVPVRDFPAMEYARCTNELKSGRLLQSIHHHLACSISVKILPESQLNVCADGEEPDKLEIFKTAELKNAVTSFAGKEALDIAKRMSPLLLENHDEVHVSFSCTLAPSSARRESAPAASARDFSAKGYALEVVAEYPDQEIVVTEKGTEPAALGVHADEDSSISIIEYSFAKSIEVHFDPSCVLQDGETLGFFSNKELTECVKSYSGTRWDQRFIFEGSTLYFKHQGKTEQSLSTFLFRVRPIFRAIEDCNNELAEHIVDKNVQQLLRRNLKTQKGDRIEVDGTKFLANIVSSSTSDIACQRWAARAFTELALHAPNSQSFQKEAKVNRQDMYERKEDKEHMYGRDYLFSNMGGLQLASKMIEHSDLVISRLGCICIAQFIRYREAIPIVISSLYWRPLLAICNNYNSISTIQLDACRYATWVVLQIASVAKDALPSKEVMPPLVSCLKSLDRLVRFNAAKALFELVKNVNMRSDLLVEGGLDFLVNTAVSKQIAHSSATSQEDQTQVEMQEEAATVLCSLAAKTDSELGITVSLTNKICSAISSTFLDIQEAIQVNAEIADGRIHTAVSAFYKISQYVSEAHPEVLKLVTGTLLQETLSMIENAGLMISPPYLFNETTPVVTKKHWEKEIGSEDAKRVKSRKDIIGGLLNFMKTGPVSFLVASVKSLLAIAKACWKTDGNSIFQSLVSNAEENPLFIIEVPKSKIDFESIVQSALEIFQKDVTFESKQVLCLIF